MLTLKKISKIYVTEDLKQTALDNVSVSFRKNEFAAILGASGSGKTTLLNIIGGLDKYDSGDLIINEISTKKYTDRDWDTYRNHRVGFVFQSYNLISHQSILQNVELALTLTGESKQSRRKKALKVLKDVGLEKHVKKLPNQLSGGQMQRVAIARALVNDPDIILADEPTGALDSETSIQIMDLLKKVAKDKLVIMVTHNPELADKYANRIIKLKDGKIIDDSNYYDGSIDTKEDLEILKKNSKKTSMSLTTALGLSLKNLMTKKGRTILTAFAGSIGIIGIALILSLSNGVQEYIDKTEKESLANFPLMLEKTTMDYTSMIPVKDTETECKEGKICTTDDITNSFVVKMSSSLIENDLKKFKKKLDNNYKNINDYVTDIAYNYNLDLQIYSPNYENGIVKVTNNNVLLNDSMESAMAMNSNVSMQISNFRELIDSQDLIEGQYEVIAGKMPSNYDELILIVDEKNQMPISLLYALNIKEKKEVSDIIERAKDGEDVKLDSINYKPEDFVGETFKLVLNSDYYTEDYVWVDHSTDVNYVKDLIDNGIDLKIVGVMKVKQGAKVATSGYVGYTKDLKEYVINEVNKSDVAKAQKENKDINIFTGYPFDGITSSYDMNIRKIGGFDLDDPSSIYIYPKDYDSKDIIKDIIEKYNKKASDKDKINYSDYVATLMSGITTIINVITYVLIAFVAISLVVSSIMIAIITYISVLERTKEIGILRAIGASKKDVTRVFKAETIIEGFVAGIFGIVITILLIIPINIIVESLTDISNMAVLPPAGAIILIIISVFLTLIAGLIPSKQAAKRDPVIALRTE